METNTFKTLTLRDLSEHTDMLNEIMKSFNCKSAASSLIKSGHAYLHQRKQLEELRSENARLNLQLRKMKDGANMFFESLDRMKMAMEK